LQAGLCVIIVAVSLSGSVKWDAVLAGKEEVVEGEVEEVMASELRRLVEAVREWPPWGSAEAEAVEVGEEALLLVVPVPKTRRTPFSGGLMGRSKREAPTGEAVEAAVADGVGAVSADGGETHACLRERPKGWERCLMEMPDGDGGGGGGDDGMVKRAMLDKSRVGDE
ncbi:hypothetical protein B0A55_09681, partial [Friedmanniomyces simplex]